MSCEKAFEFEANEIIVVLRFSDGTNLLIDRRGAEKGIVRTCRDQILLDMLAYNDPFSYMRLMLYGDPRSWLEVQN